MASGWGPKSSLVPGKWQTLKTATTDKAVCHMPWNTRINKFLCSKISSGSLCFHQIKSKLLCTGIWGTLFDLVSLCSLPHTLYSSCMVLPHGATTLMLTCSFIPPCPVPWGCSFPPPSWRIIVTETPCPLWHNSMASSLWSLLPLLCSSNHLLVPLCTHRP